MESPLFVMKNTSKLFFSATSSPFSSPRTYKAVAHASAEAASLVTTVTDIKSLGPFPHMWFGSRYSPEVAIETPSEGTLNAR